MSNPFDEHFAAASSVFLDSFGETGGVEYYATASASAVNWPEAIVNTGDLDGVEVIDETGERVTEAAFVTVPAATSWSKNGLVEFDSQKWHIAGKVVDSGTLITLALSRTTHARTSTSTGRGGRAASRYR